MPWTTIEITSWHQFNEQILSLDLHSESSPLWTFRGHANVDWKLQPSLLRCYPTDLKRSKAIGIENDIYHRFVSQAHLLFDQLKLPPDSTYPTPAWWMLMQHYSCPTRMLDWTVSPYVAAYFAVSQLFDIEGVVYAIASLPMDMITSKQHGGLDTYLLKQELAWTGEVQALFPLIGTMHTERSVVQQGCYTICTDIFGDHGKLIESSFVNNPPKYQPIKFTLPPHLKRDFMAHLGSLNITASSLFPGPDGLGRFSSEYVMNRIWQIQKKSS